MQVPATMREQIRFKTGETFRLLRWTRSVTRVEVVLDPTHSVPLRGEGDHWHYHRAIELTLVQHGDGTRFVADSIELFDSGDLVMIGTNVPHYLHQNGSSAGISIQWEFPLEHGIWSFREAAPLRGLLEAARRGLQVSGPTARSVRQRMEELPEIGGLTRIAVFLSILDQLCEAPSEDIRPLASAPFSLSGTGAHQEAMRVAVSHILAHYRDSVYLSDLLRLTAMSRATFARQFRLNTGKSFAVFLNHVRLQAVCRALRETSDNVSSIALNCGFNQLSFFNRLFRRETGMNPVAYRASRQDSP
jgi:AraC-like DNA-binding protein